MKKRMPSIETLEAYFPGKGKSLRSLLVDDSAVDNHPMVVQWEEQCFNRPSLHERRMYALNVELECHGVEYVQMGNNKRSPEFEYCNTGDAYELTIVYINSNYRISSWGDIVENGNYN